MILAIALLVAAGAPLDRGDFRVVRPLGDVKPGLVSLVLDADALAHGRDLADLRIADTHDNQVPYVVEACTSPAVVPLRVPAPTRDGRASIYHFELPYAGALELTTSARVFTRSVSLQRQRMTWESDDPDKPATRLVVQCRTTDVDLVIDDGDNAPLPITSARMTFPGYALRFIAPGGPLTLLYGAPIAAPHYDLALMSQRLLAQPARTIALRPVGRNETHVEKRVFWIAIVAAVAVLLAILGRLLVRT